MRSLPDTSVELTSLAEFLGANNNRDLFLKDRATEFVIKNAKLARSKVIAFATHGLLSLETKNYGGPFEPALVLTPPRTASPVDDGLLTASEISQLNLDAKLVILSACNTAVGKNENRDGLSSLAKAFFYAGARSLLVSHWKIDSEVTTKLTTTMFKIIQNKPSLSYSMALRQSMLIIASDPQTAHPFFWAPFSFIGAN